jgi:hypothetical protein
MERVVFFGVSRVFEKLLKYSSSLLLLLRARLDFHESERKLPGAYCQV